MILFKFENEQDYERGMRALIKLHEECPPEESAHSCHVLLVADIESQPFADRLDSSQITYKCESL